MVTIAHIGCAYGVLSVIEWVMANAPSLLSATDGLGRHPVWYCVAQAHVGIVEAMLGAMTKAHFSQRDKGGLTLMEFGTAVKEQKTAQGGGPPGQRRRGKAAKRKLGGVKAGRLIQAAIELLAEKRRTLKRGRRKAAWFQGKGAKRAKGAPHAGKTHEVPPSSKEKKKTKGKKKSEL